MFREDKHYTIPETCDVINTSKKSPRILYPTLLRAWVYTDKLEGWRQVGAHRYCRGSDLNKSLLPFLGIDDTK